MATPPADREGPSAAVTETLVDEEQVGAASDSKAPTGVGGPRSDVASVRAAAAASAPIGRLLEELLGEADDVPRVGRYIVTDVLGRGGWGTVLQAHDDQLDRRVALKLLHPDIASRHAQRLLREAKALARVSHPNVVQVYEVGEDRGRWYIAMELVEGQTLRAWQAARPGWRACVEVYLQAGAGLAAAHAAGLTHRDFKPDNCILDTQGRARVLDFGLVRATDERTESGALDPPEPADRSQTPPAAGDDLDPAGAFATRTGAMLGTPAYMPLEQFNGTAADARSDQFSFCVSLYEAVYGERPFAADGLGKHMLALMAGRVGPPPRRSRVPASLRRVLLRGLATRPADRWPSMNALLEALRRIAAPRRGGWIGVGVGVAGIAIALAVSPSAGDETLCQGARAQLRGVWDDTRRQEVESAFQATELPYAPAAWRQVAPALDAYAEDWADKHRQVCAATLVRAEQSAEVMDLRMQCLQRRKVELRLTVDVLSEANEGRVERAADVVAKLPPLSRCDDVEALRAGQAFLDDPRSAAQVQAQQERLARATVLGSAGDFELGLLDADAVLERAETLHHAPLLGETLLERAWLRTGLGRYRDAEADLERAFALAAEHHLPTTLMVHITSNLAFVVGYKQARHERGRWWGEAAVAYARGMPGDPALLGQALNRLGTVLESQGELDQALERYRQALDRFRQVPDYDSSVANALNNIGNVLVAQGAYGDALASFEQALEIWEGVQGPRHPTIATARNNLATVLERMGRLDEAKEQGAQSLALYRELLGPEHPKVANATDNYGILLYRLGDYEGAAQHHAQGLGLFVAALGPAHPETGKALNNLGLAEMALERYDQAAEHLRQASEIWKASLGRQHPHVAAALANLANALRDQGDFEAAQTSLDRARALYVKTYGEPSDPVASIDGDLGDLARAQGQLEAAHTAYARAVDGYVASLGPEHPSTAWARLSLGNLWLQRGDPQRARTELEAAWKVYQTKSKELSRQAIILAALARLEWQTGDRARARELAARARTIAEGLPEDNVRRAEALGLLDDWEREHG